MPGGVRTKRNPHLRACHAPAESRRQPGLAAPHNWHGAKLRRDGENSDGSEGIGVEDVEIGGTYSGGGLLDELAGEKVTVAGAEGEVAVLVGAV